MQLSYKENKRIKTGNGTGSGEDFHRVKRVLWIILFANFAVALVKILVGTMIKSAGMTADGYHSLTDGSA